MSDLDIDLLNELVTESKEHLENIEPGLLAMEKDGDVSPELINEIFRAIHSIKGGFGFFGLSNIQNLGHKMESVLMQIRDGSMEITPENTDALLAGVDKIRLMLENASESENCSIAEELEPLLVILGESSGTKTTDSSGASQPQENKGSFLAIVLR